MFSKILIFNKNVIQEQKNIFSLPLEEFLGSLITHKMSMKEDEEFEKLKKKNTLALRANDDDDEAHEDVDSDQDIALQEKDTSSL